MTAALFRKRLGSLVGPALVPDSIQAEAVLAKLPAADLVMVEVKRPRNLAHHQKFFVLLNKVFENQEHFKSVDEMRAAITVYIGHCTEQILKDGTAVRVPRSISFASMDQTAFEEFYEKVLDVVAEHIIPGIDKPALRQEVEAFL